MKRSYLYLIIFITAIAPGIVLAQSSDTSGVAAEFDLTSIFATTSALGAFATLITAFVRKNIWTTLDGKGVVAFAFVVSIVLAVVGFYMQLLAVTTIGQAVMFGISGAVIAVGGVSLGQSIASKAGTITIGARSEKI